MTVTGWADRSRPSGTPGKPWSAVEVNFSVGDEVREGLRVGTVTDVGTMLIQVKMTMGISRMVCPWELVKLRAPCEGAGLTRRASETPRKEP